MSSSSDSTHADPTHQHGCGKPNTRDITELDVPSPIADIPRSPLSTDEQHPPLGMAGHHSDTPTKVFSGEYERQVVTAGIIVTIQIQLLTSGSMAIATTTRALLSFGVILELLGILLAICFVQLHHPDERHPLQTQSTLVRLTSGVPNVLILTGIIGLATTLVVETLKTSLSMAVVMSGCIVTVSGVALCLFTSFRGLCKSLMSHFSVA